MYEFFLNNSVCLFIYLLIILILFISIFFKKIKMYFFLTGLALFVFDITYLMLLGFDLQKCSIITGICVILVLISLSGGRKS